MWNISAKFLINLQMTTKTQKAPLNKGDIVGIAEIKNSANQVIKKVDIIVQEAIKKANVFDYFKKKFKIINNWYIVSNDV